MLLSCRRGFTMIEMLLSVSIWILLTTTLLPPFMMILLERKNGEILQSGNHFLSEKLQEAYHGSAENGEDSIVFRNGTTFHFTRSFNEELQKWELCVAWVDMQSRNNKRCGYVK
ncbi:prepilin-type N-terminal cleavage/methylation domain-containing protein [Fredinandcohnia humi]